MRLLFSCFILLLQLVFYCQGACPRDNYANPPPLPAFPTTRSSATLPSPLTTNHWSAVAKLLRPTYPGDALKPQTNCPHWATNLVDWEVAWGAGRTPANNSNVDIPAATNVLISSCSIPSSYVFGLVTIPVGSSLVFGDAQISFQAKGIRVQGNLSIGSPTCRIRNHINITLHGRRSAQANPGAESVKGIFNTGSLDIHGVEYFPTWTRLAGTANIGDKTIFIQDCPNWQKGQSIFITTTEIKDSRDWHRNEQAVIAGVFTTSNSAVCAVTLEQPLMYKHYGGREYQAEVGLLSRNILLQGDPFNSEPTDNTPISCRYPDDKSPSTYPCDNTFLTGFGAHVMTGNGATTARFSGLELFRVGQTNVMGRYPLHFHILGNLTVPNTFYVSDCSVHRSFFRCTTIHGTSGITLESGVTITKNTGYDIIGHCYFCSEDGVEENNTVSYNLGAHIHVIGPSWQTAFSTTQGPYWSVTAGQSFGSQYTNYIRSHDDLFLADDIAASPFYFTNAHIAIYGNAASGGWAGYTFPNAGSPVGAFVNFKWIIPKNRPLIRFQGNSAHSTGYLQGHAAGVYLGGDLKPDPTDPDKMRTEYTTGRYLPARGTVNGTNGAGGSAKWLTFEDTKVFLANVGLQSWGDREEIIRFEVHDCSISTNVFGQVWIDNMLVNCRTENTLIKLQGCNSTNVWSCNDAERAYHGGYTGFQFYDTGQTHIVTNSRFTNCKREHPSCLNPTACGLNVFQYLTHSDQFTPGLMQATKNITYDNVDFDYVARPSTSPTTSTVSGRTANWVDEDGTVLPSLGFKGSRVNIGNNWTGPDWWRFNSRCVNTLQNWWCPMGSGDARVSMMVHWGGDEGSIGGSTCGNGGAQKPCPTGATITHFGRDEKNCFNVSLMPRVTGPIIASQGGWFIRYVGGTPKSVYFDEIQIERNDILNIAIPYPRGTSFHVYAKGPTWCQPGTEVWSAVCTHDYRPVGSIAEVRSAWGDAYFYDSATQLLHLRIVDLSAFAAWPYFTTLGDRNKPEKLIWNASSLSARPTYFSRGGVDLLVSGSNQFRIYVDVNSSNCNPRCADVGVVPPAFPLGAVASPPKPPAVVPVSSPLPIPVPIPVNPVPPYVAPAGTVPVAAPVTAPIAAPVAAPVAAPIAAPASAPTAPVTVPAVPTAAPVPGTPPTAVPTAAPTGFPTGAPTPRPVPVPAYGVPTSVPTRAPHTTYPTVPRAHHTNDTDAESGGTNVGAIAGAVIGVLALLALITVGSYLAYVSWMTAHAGFETIE